ncbi:MAG: DUF2207 domain-containing protein [Balneolaceae bacterium]|nr:DUF2207 domain-containing protein [Balneolaceae bacterium]
MRSKLDEGETELKELFKQHSSDFSGWFNDWKKQIKSHASDKGWIDRDSYTGAWYNAGVQVFLLLLSIASIYMAGPIGLLAALPSFALAIASLGIVRRTPEGETAYRNWNGYKKALKEAEDYAVGDELDTHFIYAVALGAGKESIESLLKANPGQVPNFGWIVVLNSTSGSPAALADTFQTLSATGSGLLRRRGGRGRRRFGRRSRRRWRGGSRLSRGLFNRGR